MVQKEGNDGCGDEGGNEMVRCLCKGVGWDGAHLCNN